MGSHSLPIADPPDADTLTEYDRAHLKLYVRLLDAEKAGADWREVVKHLFGISPDREPERAKQLHASHLARAHWVTQHGYRQLLRER